MAMAMAMPMVEKTNLVRPRLLTIVSGDDAHAVTTPVGLSACVLAFLIHSSAWAQYSTPSSSTTPFGANTPFSTSPPLVAVGAAGSGQPGFQIRRSIAVSEIYSDNVSLASAGSERSEWTTRIAPSIHVMGTGARLRFDATYTPELLSRAQQGTNDISHFLNAFGNAELLQRLLYVDVRANISQQNVSLLGPQAQSNINTTSNRTSVNTFSVSPYLRHDFGFDAVGELRFTSDAVTYSGNSSGLSNSTSNGISARLVSGPAFKLVTWNLGYDKSSVAYSDSNRNSDSERISAAATRLITPTVRLGLNVGYEEYNYISAAGGEPPRGAFWSVGPDWTPTDRTRVAASFGHRYYGPSKYLDFSHRSRLTLWKLNYSENVTTSRGNALIPVSNDTTALLDTLFLSQIPDPIARQTAVQNFITLTGLPPSLTQAVNFVTQTTFLEKRLQATFGIQGIRNTVMVNVFSLDRNSLSAGASGAGDFNTSSNVKQTGANIVWNSRLSPTLASNLSVGISNNQFSSLSSGADRLSFVRFGLTKQFDPKMDGSLLVNSLKNDSDRAGGSYTENSVAASLNVRF